MTAPVSLTSRLARIARWKTSRWALALGTLPALWACTGHPLADPVPMPQQQTDLYYDVNPVRDVDILFMIDNSPSMDQEQTGLARNFPKFISELQKIPGPTGAPELPNVRIAIVSSDMGAGGANSVNCSGQAGGDRGVFQVKPNCGLNVNTARYLVSQDNGQTQNFMGNLSDVFGCMAALGTSGCGFEHQLQAPRIGLYALPGVSEQNKGFLRPDAFLAIILITDEDDCSAQPDTNLFSYESPPGETASLRCAIKGHLCNDKEPPVGEFQTLLANCKSNNRGEKDHLIPIPELAADIKRLKPAGSNKILVSAITGKDPSEKPQYHITKRPQRDGPDALELAPACSSAGNGEATPAIRIQEFVNEFGTSGSLESICNDDLGPAMALIGKRLATMLQTRCIEAPLVDTDPKTPALDADCLVVDRRSINGSLKNETIARCNATHSNKPCWVLEPLASCTASGYKVDVDRGGAMAPAGTQQVIKCLTCPSGTSSKDPRCMTKP